MASDDVLDRGNYIGKLADLETAGPQRPVREALATHDAALRERVAELEVDNRALRKMLWLNHGHDALYGYDGEMRCSECLLDFKRDSIEEIQRTWRDRARRALDKGDDDG